MLLDPNNIKRLAVPFMNADHAEEAQLLNAAADLVEAYRAGKASVDQVTAALDAFYRHSRAHFAREEAAMVKASFPAYSLHQAEHVRLLAELGEAERSFREGKDGAALAAFLATVPAWMEGHIETMDAVTARYVVEWGG